MGTYDVDIEKPVRSRLVISPRALKLALIALASAILLASCTDQREPGDGSAEQREALERAVYRNLFGAAAGDPNHLARKEVARFASGSVLLKQPSRFRSGDSELHARIVEAVFSLVGISVVDCTQLTINCPPAQQTVSLSLQDDANGSLNALANELVFAAGRLHVSSDAFHQQSEEPLLSRDLGNTCVAGFTTDMTASDGRILNGIIINLEPEGATRLQCTAEKALFVLGLYPTPALVSTASEIVSKISTRSHIDRSILPDDAERALSLLYSARVDDTLAASDVPAVVSDPD